jgi:hypothetical protein
MLGQWRAHRFAPGEGLHRHAIVCCAAGILGSRRFQFLEFQFHLVEQLAPAFGSRPEAVVPTLADAQRA